METKTTERIQTIVDKDLIKVLLVEDDAIDRRLTERILAECSWPIEFVIDPVMCLSEAIEHLKSEKHDVMLLDLMLPDSRGIETVRRVCEVNPHMPVVVLTGVDDEQAGLSALGSGATDYLIKNQPLNDTLIRTILYALEREKQKKLILDTNHRLRETSQKLFIAKKKVEEKAKALEEAHAKLELRVEERTAELSKANELLQKQIAQREQTEWALQSSEANLRKIIVHNPDGIVIVDKNEIICFVNAAAEFLLGHKSKELLGEAFGFPIALDEATEIQIVHKTECVIVAEMRVVKIDWEGETAYLTLLHDITERKEAEEKIKETMAVKSEFISMASHELRTPLTAIQEGIRLVVTEQTGKLNDEQKEFLGIARRNVERLARLINNILDFQKLESGKMDFDIRKNDMNEVVEEIQETMASVASKKRLDLITDLDENIPAVKFDKDTITQVLTNIVNNAIKFTEKGSITITTTKDDNTIHISISDTGPGIKKEDLAKVFSQFEQLHKSGNRKVGGSGLGLAICRKIVKKHNAKIWAESELGKGTTFHFVLPIKERRSEPRD